MLIISNYFHLYKRKAALHFCQYNIFTLFPTTVPLFTSDLPSLTLLLHSLYIIEIHCPTDRTKYHTIPFTFIVFLGIYDKLTTDKNYHFSAHRL